MPPDLSLSDPANRAAREAAVLITPVTLAGLEKWMSEQSDATAAWLKGSGFGGEPDSHCLVPGRDGAPVRVLVGTAEEPGPWALAALPQALPENVYILENGHLDPGAAALGWALGAYAFDRYKTNKATAARLLWPDGADREAIGRAAAAIYLVRDLVNTPTEDMGPADLAAAAEAVATTHKAKLTVIVGDELLDGNYPAVHAVGRASAIPPRLIDIVWGDESAPKVTLVGKGVCFDSGGLGIKSSSNMKLMKKDMGGAAHVLGLAQMIMEAALPVRLRVLIPAVENSIAGNAYRPMDVVRTRSGVTVEIGHTDAEGRVILSDALAEAASEEPALLVDFATLTGAARAALGPELPALFSNDDALAAELMRHGKSEHDPVWHMPLWPGYRSLIDGKTADLTNSAETPFAGAVTAALFLHEFVGTRVPWVHLDVMAWNPKARPGRPEGGEAMGLRAVYALITERFG